MKVRGSHLAWGVLAVAVVVWAVSRWAPDDERAIRRQLGLLEDLIAKAEGENDLAGANKVRRVGDLFTPEFEIRIEPYAQVVRDRGELLRVAMAYRSRSSTVALTFRDEELDVDSAAGTAELAAVAVVSGDGLRRESYRLRIGWRREEGEWLIRRVAVVEVLEGSPWI